MAQFLTEHTLDNGHNIYSVTGEPDSPLAPDELPSEFKTAAVVATTSLLLNEELFAALTAHPSLRYTYSQHTTDVTVGCDGPSCHWETTVTGRQDNRGLGLHLFLAHQAVEIHKSLPHTNAS